MLEVSRKGLNFKNPTYMFTWIKHDLVIKFFAVQVSSPLSIHNKSIRISCHCSIALINIFNCFSLLHEMMLNNKLEVNKAEGCVWVLKMFWGKILLKTFLWENLSRMFTQKAGRLCAMMCLSFGSHKHFLYGSLYGIALKVVQTYRFNKVIN